MKTAQGKCQGGYARGEDRLVLLLQRRIRRERLPGQGQCSQRRVSCLPQTRERGNTRGELCGEQFQDTPSGRPGRGTPLRIPRGESLWMSDTIGHAPRPVWRRHRTPALLCSVTPPRALETARSHSEHSISINPSQVFPDGKQRKLLN